MRQANLEANMKLAGLRPQDIPQLKNVEEYIRTHKDISIFKLANALEIHSDTAQNYLLYFALQGMVGPPDSTGMHPVITTPKPSPEELLRNAQATITSLQD